MLVLGSERFMWHPDTGSFSAEASEFENAIRDQGYTGLDHSSGQWGFHMKSARTGRTIWFRQVKANRDVEGDVTDVEFTAWNSVTNSWIQLRVFND